MVEWIQHYFLAAETRETFPQKCRLSRVSKFCGPACEYRQDRFSSGSAQREMQHGQARLVCKVEVVKHQDDRMLFCDRLEELVKGLCKANSGCFALALA
jgi:hypothetical protein